MINVIHVGKKQQIPNHYVVILNKHVKYVQVLLYGVLNNNNWSLDTQTTGYWDCCKLSCSQSNKGNMNSPILACDAKTRTKIYNPEIKDVCHSGTYSSCDD